MLLNLEYWLVEHQDLLLMVVPWFLIWLGWLFFHIFRKKTKRTSQSDKPVVQDLRGMRRRMREVGHLK